MTGSRSRAVLAPLATLACLIAVACGGQNGGQTTATARTATPAIPTATAPAATASPVPTAAGAPQENGYDLAPTLPSANFQRMLGLAAIPGNPNEVVVLTQSGVIYRVALDGSFSPAVFGDLSGLLIKNPGNEEGLLGLAFSPRFEADGRVFVDYSAGNPRRSVLARFSVSNGAMEMGSERVILEVPQPFANHNGGQLAFGPDGYLYWGLGDGGSEGDPQENGQKLSTLLSSILRLDVSGDGYTVPPDNPFVTVAGARPEKYAYGLRNPWRFSFDRLTGDLWAGDVGQDKWEEVDRIESGGNYGWSIMEGLECYRTANCGQTGLIPPRAVYSHAAGCSITGGYVYRGAAMPELEGWYVYGDYCSGNIWALDTAADGEPVLLAESGHTITSFAEMPDGEIVALTFDGGIFRLQRAA
jgi:glucose/arabinose dehydrogenase